MQKHQLYGVEDRAAANAAWERQHEEEWTRVDRQLRGIVRNVDRLL